MKKDQTGGKEEGLILFYALMLALLCLADRFQECIRGSSQELLCIVWAQLRMMWHRSNAAKTSLSSSVTTKFSRQLLA